MSSKLLFLSSALFCICSVLGITTASFNKEQVVGSMVAGIFTFILAIMIRTEDVSS